MNATHEREFVKRLVPSVLALTLALLAGCGGGDSDKTWTESQVIDAAQLTPDQYGVSYTTPSGCDVAVVLTSKAEVDLYADAGDSVATNPSGTAGYKTSDDPGCLAEGEENLEALD